MSRKKLVLVYNPVSGNAAFRRRLDRMVEMTQQRGAMLIPYRTEKDNSPLADFLREVEPEGVLAAGGDGTLNMVVNTLLKNQLDIPVAVIGTGTSNDFATYLGVKKDPAGYMDRILAGHTRPVDIGRANGEYFVNVASAGMLTSVPHRVNLRLKNSLGKMAYYLGGLTEVPKFRPLKLNVVADNQMFEETALFFVVVNSDTVGSMRNVAEDVAVDDGKLDLLLVKWSGVTDIVSLTAALFAGKGAKKADNVVHVQAEKFIIRATEEVESDLDGEQGPLLPLTIETIPGALRFFC